MYCDQCGKRIVKTSKFCSGCGSPVVEDKGDISCEKMEEVYDPVTDIKNKLKEIDTRKKPPKKKTTVKSVVNVFKGKESIFDLFFEDDFEGQKNEDKKKLILEFPVPDSSKDLEKFAKYIDSQLQKKDNLLPVWKEKLKQVYHYSKCKAKKSEIHKNVKKYYKAEKNRELRYEFRGFVWILLIPIVLLFAYSLIHEYYLLTSVSIIAAFFELLLILYMYDVL